MQKVEYTLGIIQSVSNAPLDRGKYIYPWIVKKKPSGLLGKLVFPGGKIEEGEDPIDCIVREMKEEIGFNSEYSDWFSRAIINYRSYRLHFLHYKNCPVDMVVPDVNDSGEKVILAPLGLMQPYDPLCVSILEEVIHKL